jgi:hypothetical protein
MARSLEPEADPARARRKGELTSGFARFDYLLTCVVTDGSARAELAARCEGEWSGTQVAESTWEVSTSASPQAFEEALAPLLRPGDRAVFYYLADSKRFFRVVVVG